MKRNKEHKKHTNHNSIQSEGVTVQEKVEEHQEHEDCPEINKDIVETKQEGDFHEGHYKDIPDPKDFISHENFVEKQKIAEQHLTGEESHGEDEKSQGIWQKAKHVGVEVKDAILDGASKVKHFFTG